MTGTVHTFTPDGTGVMIGSDASADDLAAAARAVPVGGHLVVVFVDVDDRDRWDHTLFVDCVIRDDLGVVPRWALEDLGNRPFATWDPAP